MNILCFYIIPLCMALVLLILLYWMIRLDKFQDYKYTLREYWKCIRVLAADIQRRLSSATITHNTNLTDQAKISVIDLQNNRQLGQALSNSETKRKYSIRLNPNSNSLKRKNSIEYTIQVNSIQNYKQNHQHRSSQQHQLLQPQQAEQNTSHPLSNNHLNLCFHTTLQVNTLLPREKIYQPVKEPMRNSLRTSTDYFKMYMEYEKMSRTEMVSTKNARTIQNLDKRLSFSNLCEINGVKTIRDLIKDAT